MDTDFRNRHNDNACHCRSGNSLDCQLDTLSKDCMETLTITPLASIYQVETPRTVVAASPLCVVILANMQRELSKPRRLCLTLTKGLSGHIELLLHFSFCSVTLHLLFLRLPSFTSLSLFIFLRFFSLQSFYIASTLPFNPHLLYSVLFTPSEVGFVDPSLMLDQLGRNLRLIFSLELIKA